MLVRICTLFLLITLSLNSFAAEPYSWKVIRVIDGDTLEVDAKFFPSELGNIQVRVLGIDTPEKAPKAKCSEEAELAKKATSFTTKLVRNKTIIVSNVKQDKYGGRIVADVYVNGVSLASSLKLNGLAKPYDGSKKESWCPR